MYMCCTLFTEYCPKISKWTLDKFTI